MSQSIKQINFRKFLIMKPSRNYVKLQRKERTIPENLDEAKEKLRKKDQKRKKNHENLDD